MRQSGKEDRRVKYTKMIVRQSLLELMQKKEIGKITVTEICNTADINRNTFYKYYYGPENLLLRIEEELFAIITSSINKTNDIDVMSRELCRAILDNKDLSRIIFSENGNRDFLKRVIQFVRKKFLSEWKLLVKPESVRTIEKMYLFTEGGMISIITNWVRDDFNDDIDEIVGFIKMADNLMKELIGKNTIDAEV